MKVAVPDPRLVQSTSFSSGPRPEPLCVTGIRFRKRRTVKWPIHSFDFALVAVIGMVMAGAGVISVVEAVAR